MAYDTRYMLGPNLQDFLIDAQTGLPMSDGVVFFYSDINRNVPKAVYTIAGNQANYTFTNIGATVQLSAVGTTTDNNGNDIKIYYLPYQIVNNVITSTVENYFIQVYDMNGNLQFTRENWPGLAATSNIATVLDVTNYVPNGQFLFHNNNPNALTTTSTANGAMTVVSNFTGYDTAVDIWQVAPGGWTYERSHGSTATDTITFTDFNNFVVEPPNSPRFAIDVVRSVTGNDEYSDLRIKFNDVNKFQGTTQYLYFSAEASSGGQLLNINVFQYFGSGGSPSPVNNVPIQTVTLTTSYQNFVVPINFTASTLTTQGESIGTNNDDYVQIVFKMPGSTGNTFNISITDVTLSPDILTTADIVAPQTNGMFLETALFNTAPNSNPESSQYYAEDGSQYYLPMVMTSSGMQYDYSQIGKIVTSLSPTPQYNELAMDGSTYLFSGYSALGIPYSRLGAFLVASCPVTSTTPIYPAGSTPLMGTGPNFVIIGGVTSQPTEFRLVNNTSGGNNPSASGAITFTGSNPTYTFTVNTVPTAGYTWSFSGYNGSTNTVYNVWYSVDGAGTSPGGNAIQVKLVTGDTTAKTVLKTQIAINQYQFYLFNLQGYFLRALPVGTSIDPDSATRSLSAALGLTGSYLGSTETAAFLQHNHTGSNAFVNTGIAGSGMIAVFEPNDSSQGSAALPIANAGGSETRPINFAVNYFIKY